MRNPLRVVLTPIIPLSQLTSTRDLSLVGWLRCAAGQYQMSPFAERGKTLVAHWSMIVMQPYYGLKPMYHEQLAGTMS
jgi:hypothetical protein